MLSTNYYRHILIKLEFCRQIFEKSSNAIQSHENPSSGSRVVPCGQTGRQAHGTKIIVAFRNFSKAPTNCVGVIYCSTHTNMAAV
jgi:hypothetical protein